MGSPRSAAKGDMEEFVIFILVVTAVLGLVSSARDRARIKELERELRELQSGMLRLHGRVGFVEGELEKARVSVVRLWALAEAARALPPAPKAAVTPALRAAPAPAVTPMPAAAPVPVREPVPVAAPVIVAAAPVVVAVVADPAPVLPAASPLAVEDEAPESAPAPAALSSDVEAVVEAPAAPAPEAIGEAAREAPAPEVLEPAPIAPTKPSAVDHSIPEPAGWKTPGAPAARPSRERPAVNQAAHEAPRARRPEPQAEAQAPARIDWERWIGVRGAAALGAGVLVIAGLYFFKYSLDNGLISPSLRVVLGTLTGLGCLAGSERTRRRETPVLGNWLAGAGIAILYLAFWSAHAMYDLVNMPVSFGLMALVTVACGLLSIRHESLVIALLGLAGGFSTPLALSSGDDQPLGLFGYLLLLDVALLYLAHKKSWPLLGALSLGGTFLYQVGWVGERMGPDRLFLAMGIILVFAGVFGAALPRLDAGAGEKKAGGLGAVTSAASRLLPFGFGLYFGLRSDLGEHLYPLGGMLVVLVAGASWVARARRVPWLGLAAAIAGVTVLEAWLATHDAAAIAWEVNGVLVLFAAIFHGFLELERYRPREGNALGVSRAAVVASLGLLLISILAAASPSSISPWPWFASWFVLAALTLRHAGFEGREPLHLVTALVLGAGFPIVYAAHLHDFGAADWPRADRFLAVMVATAFGFQALSLLRSGTAVRRWTTLGAAAATLLAFATAIPIAARDDIGPHLYPLVALLAVLAGGAAWVARERAAGWLLPAAALGGLAVIATWLLFHDAGINAVETAALTSLYAAVFHVFLELQRAVPRAGSAPAASAGAETASLGGLILLILSPCSRGCVTPWPWFAGWVFLAALTLRHASFEGKAKLHLWVGGLLGTAFPLVHAVHVTDVSVPPASTWLALILAAAIALQVVAHMHQGEARRWASHAGGVLALLGLLDALVVSPAPSPALQLLVTGLLAFLGLISATRLGHGGWAFAAMLATAFVDTAWTFNEIDHQPASARVALVGQGLTVALFLAWPILARARLHEDRWAFRAAALAGPIWFGSLYFAWVAAFGKSALGLLPILLGVGTLAAGASARGIWDPSSQVRRSALAWLLGVSIAFVSLAIPLQLDNEWITAGWALEGVALLALWRRLDHAGLKHVGALHLAVVTARLIANPYVLDYHPIASFPVFNWLAYTYWIPALALIGAWYLLHELEGQRLRSWELAVNPGRADVGALSSAAAAVIVIFIWINLTVIDAFSTGTDLRLFNDRLPARDLTLSMAWAIYALILLAVGMLRGSAALRWTSLALIVITIGKAFLYDLAHLHDLYRVASLVGLAFSLILISLAYQRFVFGKRNESKEGHAVAATAPPANEEEETSDREDDA